MKRVRYIGPHLAVDVLLPTGGALIGVRRGGEPVSLTDEHAARLLDQSSNWELVVEKTKGVKSDGKPA